MRALAPTTSDYWSGYIAQSSRGTYTAANMYLTVPILTLTPGSNLWVDQWVGVGDGLISPIELVQVGIQSTIDSTTGIQQDATWGFVVGDARFQGIAFKLQINPGDHLWIYVSSNADGDGYNGFLITDLTQGTSETQYDSAVFSDSASAECIVEDPGGGVDQGLHLANFGTVSITGCGVYTNGQKGMAPIGNFPNDALNMAHHNIHLASVGPLKNGSDFDVTWQNTGDGT